MLIVRGSPLWMINDHLYGFWPMVGSLAAEYIKVSGYEGLPVSPKSLMDILVDANLIAQNPNEKGATEYFWYVLPDSLKGNVSEPIASIRFIDPMVIFENLPKSTSGFVVEPKKEEPKKKIIQQQPQQETICSRPG